MSDGSESLQDLIRRRQEANFVGRDEPLARFAANLGLPVRDPRRRFLFSIHGDGGVGKTFLVRQLRRIATEHGAAAAYVDEAIYGVPEAMAQIAGQLAGQGKPMKDFTRLYDTYRTRRGEVEADPQAPAGIASLMTHTAVRIGVGALRGVPAVGGVAAAVDTEALADQADRFRMFLGTKFRDHEDVRMLLSPVEALTPTFVRELAALGRHRPLALFFDTYERTGLFLDDWLLAVLEGRYGQLPADLVISVSGRAPLDSAAWSPYLAVLAEVPLAPFSEVEARRLLASRGISDERVVEVVLTLSGRLPLLVAMLAEHRPEDPGAVGDPSGDAVERFLKWETDPVRRALAVSASLPRVVNEDVLRALVEDEGDVRELFGWLRSLSFVTHQAGRCQYHAVVRSAMLRLERGQSPNRWVEGHRRLAELYRSWRMAGGEGDTWADESWRALRLEETYHSLCADPNGALTRALGGVMRASAQGLGTDAAWIQAITDAGEDTGVAALQRWGLQLTEAQLNPETPWNALLDLLLQKGDLDAPDRADAYRLRGREHRVNGRYEAALVDFNRSLGLRSDDVMTLGGRGETYRLMKRYEEALVDLTRTLDLDPTDGWSLGNRALVYASTGRIDDAIADLTRAIELDPAYEWAIAVRGQQYRRAGRYEEALADFDLAIRLNPTDTWTIGNRVLTYRQTGRNDEALAELNRAVQLDPDDAWLAGLRGELYRLTEQYEEALADFSRAIELDPTYFWVLRHRGRAYRALGRYEEALADTERSLALDSESGWPYYCMALVWFAMGNTANADGYLVTAAALYERVEDTEPEMMRNHSNLLVCRVAQGDFDEAHRLAGTFLARQPNRAQIDEALQDLADLASVPGVDRDQINSLVQWLNGSA